MGLKKSNYEVKEMGINIPEAYAQITQITTDINGVANAVFEIQQDRESVSKKRAIDVVKFGAEIDKEQPLYKQMYEKAKETVFVDWEDDIVTE